MTKVNVSWHNNYISEVIIQDHAGFDEYGKDIVCAAISSIVFGILNALSEFGLDESKISIEDANIKIKLSNENSLQIIIKTMLIQLKTIQDSYSEYLVIKEN